MTGLWATLKIVFVLSLLGYGAWFALRKVQKGQFNKIGDKGRIQVIDGVSLNHQTSTYLMEVDEQKILIVVGQGGVHTMALKEKSFQEILNNGLEVGVENE